MQLNYIDLFAGYGGFKIGLGKAGFEFKKHYFSEIDKHAIACYRHGHKSAEFIGSVVSVVGYRHINTDLITFGFPCQNLSISGLREGLKGAKSSLFYHATRLLRETKSKMFIWENVAGLLSSNGGDDFAAVCEEISTSGYVFDIGEVNTSWFLPQNRERIYSVGFNIGFLFENLLGNTKWKLSESIVSGYIVKALFDSLSAKQKKWGTKKTLLALSHVSESLRREMEISSLSGCVEFLGLKFKGDKHNITLELLEQIKSKDVFTLPEMSAYTKAFAILSLAAKPDIWQVAIKIAEQTIKEIQNADSRRIEVEGTEEIEYTDGLFQLSQAEKNYGNACRLNATRGGSGGEVLPFGGSDPKAAGSDVIKEAPMVYPLVMERTEEGKKLRKEYEAGLIKHGFNEHRSPKIKTDGINPTLDSSEKSRRVLVAGKSQSNRVYNTDGNRPTLNSGSENSGNQSPKVIVGTLRTHKDGNGFREMKSGLAPTFGARPRKDGSGQAVIQVNPSTESGGKQPYQQNRVYDSAGETPALDQGVGRWSVTTGPNSTEEEKRIRRLTEIEAERIQGLPDNFTKTGLYEDGNGGFKEKAIPSTQRYKLCGNGVSVPVVECIGKSLMLLLSD